MSMGEANRVDFPTLPNAAIQLRLALQRIRRSPGGSHRVGNYPPAIQLAPNVMERCLTLAEPERRS
jgi:hypothetical protein